MTAHRTHPPTRAMRETPDIDQLKRQARELLEAYRAQSADAVIEVAAHHRTATPESFALHDAQLVLARSFNATSWTRLVHAVKLADAIWRDDLDTVRALITGNGTLVREHVLLFESVSDPEIRCGHRGLQSLEL